MRSCNLACGAPGPRPALSARPLLSNGRRRALQLAQGAKFSSGGPPGPPQGRFDGPSSKPPPRPAGNPADVFRGLTLNVTPKTLDSSERAASPGPGAAGRQIQVQTNLFKLGMAAPPPVHQYSVTVSAAAAAAAGKPARKISREDESAAVQALAARGKWGDEFVFDNAGSLFSVKADLEGEAEVKAGSKSVKVKLSKVKTLDLKQSIYKFMQGGGSTSSAADVASPLNLLDMISKAQPAADKGAVRTPTGYLSYSTPAGGSIKIGSSMLKMLAGFRSSVRVLKEGVFMSVDHKVGVVLEDGPLLTLLMKAMGTSKPGDLSRLANNPALVDISGFQVKFSHIPSTVRLKGFSPQSARTLKFVLKEDGKPDRTVSVEQYMKEKYNIKLQHPDLPCVVTGSGAAFPLELCTVVKAQRRTQLKSARDQADLIRTQAKQSVVGPQERLQRLMQAMQGPLGSLGGPLAQAFGLALAGKDPVKVAARLIPGPSLEYRGPKVISTGSLGTWSPPASAPVNTAGVWSSGAVLVLLGDKYEEGFYSFMQSLKSALNKVGCSMPPAIPISWYGPSVSSEQEVEAALKGAVQEARDKYGREPELVLVVLPGGAGGEALRNKVKAVGHSKLGVVTQCFDPVKAGISSPYPLQANKVQMYCGNLGLKINTKLGGTTAELAGTPMDWAPYLGNKHFMVIGADVSRSAVAVRGAKNTITYAAVVGTCDRQAVRLSEPQMIAQIGKNDDLIYGMQDAAEGLLRSYRDNNQEQLPEVILVYRDGVSESSYDQVLAVEFKAIKDACSSIQRGYNPRVTFVVVSKSHNNRFFPLAGDNANTHRSGNILPGTVVDQRVVDPFAFEFFLNSHAGLLGTNRVPKYTVLVDEFGFSSDSMQIFTHWICHTYSLCHRSVSVPPVAKYADKAAEEARQVGAVPAGALLSNQQAAPGDYVLLAPMAMSGASSMSFV